jgi:hypothetical protein
MNIVWTSASLVATRCFQVYTQAQTQKSQMEHDMSAQLYDKMQDSQEGVVGFRGPGGAVGQGRARERRLGLAGRLLYRGMTAGGTGSVEWQVAKVKVRWTQRLIQSPELIPSEPPESIDIAPPPTSPTQITAPPTHTNPAPG